jgi:MFS family permease
VPSSRFGVFAYRDFSIYFAGGLLSNVGTWLQTVAAAVLMLTLTGSPLMVGLLGTASFLPIILFIVFAGVASDRFDRQQIVIVTHVLAMLTTAGLAVATLSGQLQPWMLLVGSFLINSAYAFAKPALTALLPALVPRETIAEATSINVLQFTIGQTIGSLMAAAILVVSSAGIAFAINAITFIGPIGSMLLIHPRPFEAGRRAPIGMSGLAGGFQFLRATPALLAALVAVSAAASAVEATRTLSPVLVTQVLGQDDGGTGLMIASVSLGSAISILVIPRMLRTMSITRIAFIGFLVQVVGLGIQAVAPSLTVAIVGAFLVGVGFSLSFTQMTALLQIASPDELRGRVMSIHSLFHLGSRPFAALLVGSAATLLGGRPAIVLFALLAPIGLFAVSRATGVGEVATETLVPVE